MEQLLVPLALLACPVGMGLMMFLMGRGMRGGKKAQETSSARVGGDLASLKAEQARLSARIEEIETRRSRAGVP